MMTLSVCLSTHISQKPHGRTSSNFCACCLWPCNGTNCLNLVGSVAWLTNKDISLTVRGRLYSSCMRSGMLHGGKTWPIRKENEVALQRAEMRMVRWMCGVRLQDRVPSKELRGRLELEDNLSTTAEQVAMVWACAAKRRQ